MNKPIYNMDEIPKPEEDKEFWAFITNPNYKKIISFLLLNETRKFQLESLPVSVLRSHTAKIKAFQEILDFPNALISAGEEDKKPSDELDD